ncbi:MAG: hypothetical protein ACM3NS_06335 [Deltaproteobacteria bacterium]
MKVTCPKCESDDVQRLAMIYQHGTATSVSRGSTLAAVGDDLAVAGTVMSGKQQSLLAQQAAPPQPRESSGCGFVLGVLAVLFSIGAVGFGVTMTEGRIAELTLAGFLFCLGVVALVAANSSARGNAEYNRTTYPRLKEQWDRTWLCLRCGNRFEASL